MEGVPGQGGLKLDPESILNIDPIKSFSVRLSGDEEPREIDISQRKLKCTFFETGDNGELLTISQTLQAMYPEVEFSRFEQHPVTRLLGHLNEVNSGQFDLVRNSIVSHLVETE